MINGVYQDQTELDRYVKQSVLFPFICPGLTDYYMSKVGHMNDAKA